MTNNDLQNTTQKTKNSPKIPKRSTEAVNRMTDITMAKRKRTNRQLTIELLDPF